MYGSSIGALGVDLINLSQGTVTSDIIAPIVGDQGDMWFSIGADISPLLVAPSDVWRIAFRATANPVGGEPWESDLAIDGFFAGDPNCAAGQPPTPGVAVLDIATASNCIGSRIGSGIAGPYYANVSVGTNYAITMSGAPMQPIVCVVGSLSVAEQTFASIGQLDLANPVIIADGTGPSFLDALWVLDASGSRVLTLPAPVSLQGQVLTFQCAMFNASVGATLSNAVQVTFL